MTHFGTEPYKLVRNNAPSTSIEAACQVNTTKLEKLVYESILKFGERGCIAHDVETMHADKAPESIHARFSTLFQKGLIEYTGEKRKGKYTRMQRVARAIVGGPISPVPKRTKNNTKTAHTDNALAWLLMSAHTDDEHVATAIRILRRASE